MGVLKYSINLSEHLLNSTSELADIENFIDQLRAPMCPGYVSQKYPVNQKILNAMFRHSKMSGALILTEFRAKSLCTAIIKDHARHSALIVDASELCSPASIS